MVAGIVFDHGSFKHMFCNIDAGWSKMGMTEVRSCDYQNLKSARFSAKIKSNHDDSEMTMEKIPQTGKR